MSSDKHFMTELLSSLKQQRDELKLQMHLAGMEAKEEFEKAQERLDELSHEFEPVKDAVDDSVGNLLASFRLVGEEIKSSFDRIRKSI